MRLQKTSRLQDDRSCMDLWYSSRLPRQSSQRSMAQDGWGMRYVLSLPIGAVLAWKGNHGVLMFHNTLIPWCTWSIAEFICPYWDSRWSSNWAGARSCGLFLWRYMHKSLYTEHPSNTLAYQDTTVTIVLFWTQFLQGFMNPQSRPIGRKALTGTSMHGFANWWRWSSKNWIRVI